MRYLISSFGDRDAVHRRSPEWVEGWMSFLLAFTDELVATGELVQAESLDEARHAVRVAPDGTTSPGTIPGLDASLLDFWIVAVDDRERAEQIAARLAAALGATVEVRGLPDASSIPP